MENKLRGGKADKINNIQDLYNYWAKIGYSKGGISKSLKKQLEYEISLGKRVEREHTSDEEKIKEIVFDHLVEFPDYYTRLKNMENKINEGAKNYLAAAALGLNLMGTPNITKGSSLTQTSQNQSQTNKILDRVSFAAYQPISNPDLDLVHGALGSNRLQDDFEKRVEEELTNQVKNGNTPSVSNIQVKTYIQGDRIITKASCDIIQSNDGIAYTHFTTRGSIGSNYGKRHDIQINGLISRLENYYGGIAKQIGNPIDISFNLNGNEITYRQSFFIASDDKNQQKSTKINVENKEIIGSDINDLRNKLNSETKNIYIDINSINIDMNNYKISYKTGDVKIYKISLLFDDSGNLQNRLKNVKIQNQTFKEIKIGKVNNIEWVVGLIPYEEKVNETTKILVKRLLRENLSDRKEYLSWKRKNVTLRGISNAGNENNAGAAFGEGLYTAFLGNKEMAKKYGQVYFVVNAIPKKPKIVSSVNEAEIFLQTLVTIFCKEHGVPRSNYFFSEKTSVAQEIIKMGYDGFVIKGREMVNYKPKDILYFTTEDQLYRYYLTL